MDCDAEREATTHPARDATGDAGGVDGGGGAAGMVVVDEADGE